MGSFYLFFFIAQQLKIAYTVVWNHCKEKMGAHVSAMHMLLIILLIIKNDKTVPTSLTKLMFVI